MIKIPYLLISLLSVVIILQSCNTKEIRLVTNVDMDFTQTNTEVGYVNELLPTTIVVTPEVMLPEFNYYFSYEVLEGSGVFVDEDKKVLQSSENIALVAEEGTEEFLLPLSYKAIRSGLHHVKVTASDNFEKSLSATLTYDIKDIPVLWTVSSPLVTAEEREEIPVSLSFTQKEINNTVTYQVRYTINEGSGKLITKEGNEVSLGNLREINFGVQDFIFIPNQVGTNTLIFELVDSNDQIVTETLSFTISEFVEDIEPPIITPVGLNPFTVFTGGIYADAGATAVDNKDDDDEVTTNIIIDASAVNTEVAGTYTVLYSVNDSSGNIGTASRIVRVLPNTSDVPEFTVKGMDRSFVTSLELGALYIIGTIDNLMDNGTIVDRTILDQNSISNSIPGVGEYSVVYQATDNDGNNTVITESVSVQDTTAPNFLVKGNVNNFITKLQAGELFVPGVVESIEDQSDTDGGVISDISNISNAVVNVGNYEVVYTVTDSENNSAIIRETVLVTDTTAPTFEVKGNTTSFSTTLELGVFYTLGSIKNIIDNGSTNSGILDSFNIVDTAPAIGEYSVIYTVTDDQNNETAITETVIVLDKTNPDFTVKDNSNDFTTTLLFGENYSIGTIDNVTDLSPVVETITGASTVDTTTSGSYEVIYMVTDDYGNSKVIKENVVVRPKNTPAIAIADSITIDENTDVVPTFQLIPVTINDTNLDNLGLTLTVKAENEPDNGAVEVVGDQIKYTPNLNYIGTDFFIYTLTDSDNNPSTQARVNITITDATKPVILLTGSSTISVELNRDTYAEQGAVVIDNEPILQTVANISGTVNEGSLNTYTITYTAMDDVGNEAIPVIRTVNVVDTLKPDITRNGDATINLFIGETYIELGAIVTDNDPVTASTANIDGDTVDTLTSGTYYKIYSITDQSGNIATSVNRTIIVSPVPNRAPVARIVANPKSGSAPLTVTFDGGSSSDADGDPLTYSWSNGTSSRTTTRTFNVSGTMTLTVSDGSLSSSEIVNIKITTDSGPCDNNIKDACINAGQIWCPDSCSCTNASGGISGCP